MKWDFYDLVMNNKWHVDFYIGAEEVTWPN
jgi:hypothetical protein